ncbi:MAG: DNA-3-methyladenine glycosylase I [Candidatus Omnitrophica bacterium]|nr:DNA-3-methyladenine glycosylase I [Candidatus Omnitrophota bacterium]
MKKTLTRCGWCSDDPIYIKYHDQEWGRPVHDDRRLFEFLILEGAQAGLSWLTVLKKRHHYRKAFDHFDARAIARYDARKIKQLLNNDGIIRNRLKIQSAIRNAKAFLKIQKEFGSFDRYLWSFQPLSDALSSDLQKRGFSFVGPTIIYAFMQAVGMVNDHTRDCFLYQS